MDPVINSHAIAFQLDGLTVYWYGVLLAFGALCGFLVTLYLARRAGYSTERITDIAFIVLISGFIGARLYHVLNEFSYYQANPSEIIRVWNGGLAIQGGLLFGLVVLWLTARRLRLPLLRLTDLLAPGVILGQAIGRWGNFVNNELFGRPTDLPWGIWIDPSYRTEQYLQASHFHPVFAYESAIDLAAFVVLLILSIRMFRSAAPIQFGRITALYAIFYGVGRIVAELFRFDPTPHVLGIRLPLVLSAVAIVIGVGLLVWLHRKPARLPMI